MRFAYGKLNDFRSRQGLLVIDLISVKPGKLLLHGNKRLINHFGTRVIVKADAVRRLKHDQLLRQIQAVGKAVQLLPRSHGIGFLGINRGTWRHNTDQRIQNTAPGQIRVRQQLAHKSAELHITSGKCAKQDNAHQRDCNSLFHVQSPHYP